MDMLLLTDRGFHCATTPFYATRHSHLTIVGDVDVQIYVHRFFGLGFIAYAHTQSLQGFSPPRPLHLNRSINTMFKRLLIRFGELNRYLRVAALTLASPIPQA